MEIILISSIFDKKEAQLDELEEIDRLFSEFIKSESKYDDNLNKILKINFIYVNKNIENKVLQQD